MLKRLLTALLLFVMVGPLPASLASSETTQAASVPMVSAGYYHTVGLKTDGTVVAVGATYDGQYGQCNVSGWTSIVQASAGFAHTLGLRSDGTVVAVGHNDFGQCNVGSWSNIVQVSAGYEYSVGLKSDGTVVTVGMNNFGQSIVANWTHIREVSAGWGQIVGLKEDGTVVAVGAYSAAVSGWTSIRQVSVGVGDHVLGLRVDGTVVAAGDNYWGNCNVGSWTGITQVVVGDIYSLGLKSDGTVVGIGLNPYGQLNVGNWTGISQIASGGIHTVGLKADGTVVATGWHKAGQCYVRRWSLRGTPTGLEGTQDWFLYQDSLMYRGNDSKYPVNTISVPDGGSNLWVSNEAAIADMTFSAGRWTGVINVQLGLEAGEQLAVTVGTWNGSEFTAAPTGSQTLTSGGVRAGFALSISAGSFTVEPGEFLALKVDNPSNRPTSNMLVLTGEDRGFVTSPSPDPGYPLPELPAGVLFGFGLTGLAAHFLVKRRRSRSVVESQSPFTRG
jgi:hypothetical protein